MVAAGARERSSARGRRLGGRVAIGLWLMIAGVVGCDEGALQVASDAGAGSKALTPQQAKAVVARVGDRTITLGDFVATLESMNQYDRLRYQTKDQRRRLLEEMIDGELLAQEAERRGLDKEGKVQQAIRQILRDAMLAKAREQMAVPADLSAADVRAYYEQHADQFREPERRRVSAIVMADRTEAEDVLQEALAARSAEQWGKLFYEHSSTAPKKRNPLAPADLAGDLGIVGPAGDSAGMNSKVPPAVQQAVFQLAKVGDVYGKLVEAGGKYYVVRMSGRTEGHTRSLAEADRNIRVRLLQERVKQREAAFLAELRKQIPVTTDDEALAKVKVPQLAADAGAPREDDRVLPSDRAPSAEPTTDADAGP